MPEGDTLHRAALSLQPLVGERLEVESPHPRARATGVAERLDGRRLESVQAIGKNLVFRFEGRVVLRSHLRMSGRWTTRPAGTSGRDRPWLVLRGRELEGVLWGGPVLELHLRALRGLGPDVLAVPPDVDSMLERLRRADGGRRLGEALQDQSLVSGIGNMWAAETLWLERLSPWLRLDGVREPEVRRVLELAARRMRGAVEAGREPRTNVHHRAGRPCPRCGALIQALGLGEANRTAYWCPICQPFAEPVPGAARDGRVVTAASRSPLPRP
jgi:endonuclease VIII